MVTTRSGNKGGSAAPSAWVHAPTRVTLAWLAVSLPLVIWDSVYVLFRPWTMEGGSMYWPLYVPYKLYGTVDHVYGWKAFDAGSGFTAAQGALNVVETLMYLVYAWIYYTRAAPAAGHARALTGRSAAVAVLLAFSAAVMTLSKTVLYCRSCPGSSPGLRCSKIAGHMLTWRAS
jgi:hypothetical protein